MPLAAAERAAGRTGAEGVGAGWGTSGTESEGASNDTIGVGYCMMIFGGGQGGGAWMGSGAGGAVTMKGSRKWPRPSQCAKSWYRIMNIRIPSSG